MWPVRGEFTLRPGYAALAGKAMAILQRGLCVFEGRGLMSSARTAPRTSKSQLQVERPVYYIDARSTMSASAPSNDVPSPASTAVLEECTWRNWPYTPQTNDFARLIPANRKAQHAFRRVVNRVRGHEDFPEYSKRFMYYDFTSLAEDISTDESPSDTGSVSPLPQPDLPSVTGFYRLNMRDLKGPGYIMGRQPQKSKLKVELILGRREDGIRSYHGRLYRDLDNGALLVISDRHQIFADGISLKRDHKDPDQPLREYQLAVGSETFLTLGDLSYRLQLLPLGPDEAQKQIALARLHRGDASSQVDFNLSALSTPDVHIWRDYELHPPFAKGAQGSVAYGRHRHTGNVYAVKIIQFQQSRIQDVRNEINLLQRYTHVSTVLFVAFIALLF